jgi:hypothetical protein
MVSEEKIDASSPFAEPLSQENLTDLDVDPD